MVPGAGQEKATLSVAFEKETLSSRSVDHGSIREQAALRGMHAADVSNACAAVMGTRRATTAASPPFHLLDVATSHSLSAIRFQIPTFEVLVQDLETFLQPEHLIFV